LEAASLHGAALGGRWPEIFAALTIIRRNQAVTIHSGTSYQQAKDREYALERLRQQMKLSQRAATKIGLGQKIGNMPWN
jgi:hypothetical protein